MLFLTNLWWPFSFKPHWSTIFVEWLIKLNVGWKQLRALGFQRLTDRWEPFSPRFPHPSCVSILITATVSTSSPWLCFACPPSGPQRSRALLSELFQAQSVPASTTIEFCFHYAGFLWSSKLIWILSSLLRPRYKGLCFCLPWYRGGFSHFPRMAFLLARTACPSSLCQGSEFPDLQAVGGCPPGLGEACPGHLHCSNTHLCPMDP